MEEEFLLVCYAYFGFPVKLDELIALCKKWSIPIVEDAAESIGSTYKGQSTGSFGEIAGFHLMEIKL